MSITAKNGLMASGRFKTLPHDLAVRMARFGIEQIQTLGKNAPRKRHSETRSTIKGLQKGKILDVYKLNFSPR